jgi:A/G-specific adenine glycosylase
MSDDALTRGLLGWYARARRDLPWRRVRDPYATWVSETMLQQTRVQTVLPYYERFMRELPTLHALAEASEERVLALWSGLGYYRRARMLQTAAKRVASEYGGRIPEEASELRRLEGVGAYTAGAIASIAFGRRAALVDGNVARVLARLFAIQDDVKSARGNARLWDLAQRLVAGVHADPGEWNQALMELGATVCAPRDPLCDDCPVRESCQALAAGIVSELPRASLGPPPLPVRRAAIVLASSRSVLLARRRKEALFGGLWEPPSTDGTLASLAARLGLDARRLKRAGEVVHVLTHRRMRVEVARGALPRRRDWPIPGGDYDAIEPVPWKELNLTEPALMKLAHMKLGGGVVARAHSTLTRKVLIVANVAARDLRWKK